MTTQTAQRDVLDTIAGLSDSAKEKLAEYVAFLRYQDQLEEQEDEEDIAMAEARRDEPDLPFEDLMAKIEAEHGSLD